MDRIELDDDMTNLFLGFLGDGELIKLDGQFLKNIPNTYP